ncbi:MAG: hypothetical protein OHK0046_03950 [Anaerolineae bacterium]
MQTSIIEDVISRANRALLIVTLGGVLILLAGAALSSTYYYNFFSGPFAVDNQTLLSIDSVDGLREYFITVSGNDVFHSGYQLVETSESGLETVKANYGLIVVDDRLLLVETTADLEENLPTEFTGTLVAMPSDILAEVVTDLVRDYPDLKSAMLPYMLKTDDFYGVGIAGLVVGAIVLLAVIRGLVELRRRTNPQNHPVMRGLRTYGDPEMIASQINRELQMPLHTQGDVRFTQHWVVHQKKTTLRAMPYRELTWSYKKITQRRVNGIPAGKAYAALLWDRHGKSIEITGKENAVDTILSTLLTRAPWAIHGFSDELEKTWKRSREQFIAAVEERRTQVRQQRGEPQLTM